MKRIWKIIIIFIIILFLLSFFSNKHGYIEEYKTISGVYVEQEIKTNIGIYEITRKEEIQLPGLRKGLLKTRGDRISYIFNDIGDGIENFGLFVIGCQEKDILYSIDMFVGIIYDIIDLVYNFLLLFTTGGEAILILANIPLIGNIIEWIIQLIVSVSGDILGEFLLIIGIIYLTRLFHEIFQKIFKKNKKGNKYELASKNSDKLAKVDKTINNIKKSLNQTSKKRTFFTKLRKTFQKIWKFIISKKTYFIIGTGILLSIIIITTLLENTKKTGGNIIELYDKYGEVQCELFDDLGNFEEYIYVKNDKFIMTSSNINNITGAFYSDGNKDYTWGNNIYFGGYMGCNSHEVTEDINGNILDTRQSLINMFGDDEDGIYIVKNCKHKVSDSVFDFKLPEYCDFENNISQFGWKEFKYKNLISFNYPDGLKIQKKPYMYLSSFSDGGNIYVNVYDFENFIEPMLDKNYKNAGILLEMNELGQKKGRYEAMLNSISKGNGVKTVNSPDFFDHISMYNTVGPIAAHKINVDGVNGLIVNYYFTDDKSKGCISQFVTELLLLKSYNEIISIVFKNNFGEVENILKDNYYDFYETQNGQYCSEKDFWLTKDLEEFYKYGGNTSAYEFQINYNIINSIIKTLKINK